MKKTNNLGMCTYTCASCSSSFEILSTKPGSMSIDICSGCHPFYVGSNSNVTMRGRAEKLASKFNVQKSEKPSSKKTTSVKKKSPSKKSLSGFENL